MKQDEGVKPRENSQRELFAGHAEIIGEAEYSERVSKSAENIAQARSKFIDHDRGEVIKAFVEDGVFGKLATSAHAHRPPGGDHFCNINGLDTPQAKKKITAWLEEKGFGKATVQYKLSDWLFSRAAVLGRADSNVHCEKHGTVPVGRASCRCDYRR